MIVLIGHENPGRAVLLNPSKVEWLDYRAPEDHGELMRKASLTVFVAGRHSPFCVEGEVASGLYYALCKSEALALSLVTEGKGIPSPADVGLRIIAGPCGGPADRPMEG